MPTKPQKVPTILPPKDDFVFKMLFGEKRNIHLLKEFLRAVLHLNAGELKTISLENTHLKAEYLKDKLNILDVKAELAGGKIIDIEIQVEPFPEMRSRVTYYESKLITEQIGEGGNYSELKPAISIIIVNYPLITESKKCHTRFRMLETEEGFLFNDLQEINVLDLTKAATEKDKNLLNWLQFLKSEKEADFMALAAKSQIIKQAYDTLKIISADKKTRYMYESRLKGERDQYAREHAAEARGRLEGEARGKAKAEEEFAPVIAEKDNTLAEQARRIAELERLLNRK